MNLMKRNKFSRKRKNLILVASAVLIASIGGCAIKPVDSEPKSPQTAPVGTINLKKAMGRSIAASTAHDSREQPVCETKTVAGDQETFLAQCQTMTLESQELCQPKEFDVRGNALEMALDIQIKWQCVPLYEDNEWQWTVKRLRNYGYNTVNTAVDPSDPNFTQFSYNYPGPTYRMRRDSMEDETPRYRYPGDKFQMWLYNNMGATAQNTDNTCLGNDAQPIAADGKWAGDIENSPNCFHGLNSTNFHYHGFHISPQFHQDYVLLTMYPKGTLGVTDYNSLPANERKTHTLTSIAGAYYYDLDPLPHNQAEGTHWFHAHKHGSTSTQLMNGLSGTFLIEGPLDYWLNDYFGYDAQGDPLLHDQLMVIQQINDTITTTPRPLINGQAVPFLTINVGETQRWRFVAATMNANAELTIDFGSPECLTVKQIQMDGVQFGPENYAAQPLLDPTTWSVKLFAGNRADFLVQIPNPLPPECVTEDGLMHLTYARNQTVDAEPETPVVVSGNLFSLNIHPQDLAMKPPPPDASWPALPEFLTLDPDAGNENQEEMVYTQKGNNGGDGTPKLAPDFYINDTQFTASCVPPEFTVKVGSKAKWSIVNEKYTDRNDTTGNPYTGDQTAHPFHIHTNPFLVLRNGSDEPYAYPIWQDVIGLPSGTTKETSSVDLHMTFDDYTGSYVNHCHILGHEDRGMMTLVQSVCPDSPDPDRPNYGTPTPNAADDCGLPIQGEYICPAPEGHVSAHH